MLAEHVEAGSAPGLEALRASAFPLSDIDRQQVAIFTAAQLTRGRAIRNNFTEALSEVMSMALSVTAQNASDEHFESVLGHALTADERDRLLHNREHRTIRPTNAAVLRGLLAPIADVADVLLMRTLDAGGLPYALPIHRRAPRRPHQPVRLVSRLRRRYRRASLHAGLDDRWCSPTAGRAGRRASSTAQRSWPAV